MAEGNFGLVNSVYNIDIWNRLRQAMTKAQMDQLIGKILKGCQQAFYKLVERTKLEDGELVVSKNGKIMHIKAREFEINKN